MGWLRGTKMATDETAKRSNCNHETPRAHNSINKIEKDIEPSQMVFQGDARNELGPSPRGAICRKHQKTTSVETSFHKKFGTELPRL